MLIVHQHLIMFICRLVNKLCLGLSSLNRLHHMIVYLLCFEILVSEHSL